MSATSSPQQPEGADFTQRVTYTFMIGVYLAVNAIRDLYLLIEGPDCTYMKTQYVQGNHDWLSTLTSVSGLHRVANTALHPAQMSGSREESLQATLQRIASHPAVPAVVLTSMPMAFITGAEYARLTRQVASVSGKPVVHVPGKSLSGDWIDGYAEVLLSLARQLDLSGGSPCETKAAVVGYLFDRNEQDHIANLRELEAIFGAGGLELVSVWLSGSRFCDLHAVRDAGIIVSLPYGRKAAREIARRTGARLLEWDLPFGLDATERWVRELAAISGARTRAQEYVDRELSSIVPRLEWVVPFVFQQRAFGYVGDPFLLPGIASLADLVGAHLKFAVVTNRPHHAAGLASKLPGVELMVHPKMKSLMRALERHFETAPPHLTIANNAGILGGQGAVLEFGFPSYFRHALYDRPFLGFQGAIATLDSMANALRWQEVEQTRRAMR